MSIAEPQVVIVDYKLPKQLKPIRFLQYDTNIIKFVVEDNAEAADLSNITNIVVNLRRPDEKVISQVLTADGNEIIYRLTSSEMLKIGVCEVALHLYDDEDRVTIAKFKILIDDNIEIGDAPTVEDVSLVQLLIESVNERLVDLVEYDNQLTAVQNGLNNRATIQETARLSNVKADKTYVDSIVSNLSSGGPRDVFYSIEALESAFPNGEIGTYLVFDATLTDGAHSFIWSDGTWVDIGIYQGLGIGDNSITKDKLADNAVTVDKLDIIQKSPQLYNHTPSSYTKDVRLDGTNGTVYEATNFYTTDFVEVEPNRTIVFGSSPHDATYMGFNSTVIYDKDKKFISHIPAATTSFVTPPNARYIRKTTAGSIERLGIFYDEVSTDFTYWRKLEPSLGVSESEHAKIADRAMVADSATSALTANVALRAETVADIEKVVSKQKFNIDTVMTNHRLSGSGPDGIPTPMQNFTTSDFIPIEEGTTNIIIAKNFSAGIVNFNNIAYYTEDKTYISGFNTGSSPVDEYGRLNLTPPANAKFMRYCVQGVYQRIGIFFNTYSNNFNYYKYYEFEKSNWFGKKIVAYGDSLVAGASNATTTWLGMLAKQFSFEPINRGIGGSTVLQSDTERIAWVADGVNKTLGEYGEYVSRPSSLNDGSGQATGTTQPEGTVEILSSMCTDARVNTIPTDADAIIILAGANGMDEASYRLMLQKIYTRCPQAIVFCCSNTFRYNDDARTQITDVSANNNTIRNLSQEFGSHYIDLKGMEGINHYNKTTYMIDKVHASTAGNQRRAMVIGSVLKTKEPLM